MATLIPSLTSNFMSSHKYAFDECWRGKYLLGKVNTFVWVLLEWQFSRRPLVGQASLSSKQPCKNFSDLVALYYNKMISIWLGTWDDLLWPKDSTIWYLLMWASKLWLIYIYELQKSCPSVTCLWWEGAFNLHQQSRLLTILSKKYLFIIQTFWKGLACVCTKR